MRSAKSIAIGLGLHFALLVSAAAWAQTSDGTLVGAVTDPTGAVVPNATVSAVSAAYGQPRETHTGSVGAYRLEGLQAGTYVVTVSASQFKTLSVTGVVINGSLTTTINAKLELAAAEQTVEVKATALQTIDTQSGELGGTLSNVEVAQLPYSSFNPADLVMTLPGVHDTPQGQGAVNTYLTEGIAFSVNGTRPRANNFLIDGQDDNDYGITGQAYQPINLGAIQEVAVLTNAYSAEYGRGGGSVTNYIYKSGTNNFHGNVWEVNQNSAVASIPAQDVVANPNFQKPYYNENTFGFDVGGPVKKDKLFVFGTAQWDITHQNVVGPTFNLPDAAGIATLKSLESSYPNIGVLLEAIGSLESPGIKGVTSIPLGNDTMGVPRPSVEIGEFQVGNVLTKSKSTDWNVRADWQLSNNDKLIGSAIRDVSNLSPDNFANPNALPNFQTEQSGPAGIYWGKWAHIFSPTVLNEVRFSYTNIHLTFLPTPATLAGPQANLPFIQFGNDINFPSIGIDSNFPQGRGHSTYEIQEALSWTANRHSVKAGVDVTVLRPHDILALTQRGDISYAAGGGYNSLGNFIDDFTGIGPNGFISKGFGDPQLNSRATIFAPYLEDAWRVNSNLTISAGLRYEYWGTLANALQYPGFNTNLGVGIPSVTDASTFANAFAYKQVADKRNFAPRLGIAYTPHWAGWLLGDGKTVFRAGYGIFYDGLFSNIIDNTGGTQPNTLGGTVLSPASGRGTSNASTTGIASIPLINPTLLIESMQSNLHNPMTQQWNANIERELPLGIVLTLAYAGTRGEHLFVNQDYNPALGLDATTFQYDYTNPIFNEIEIRTNGADSKYNSGIIEVERALPSLTLRASYTYSHFQDDSSEVFPLGTTLAVGLPSFAQVLTNQRSDWGNSAFDQRHRLTIAYVARLPYSHSNAILRAVTDRWEWSGIATLETGTPNTVEDGFDNSWNGHANSRPDLANPNAPLNMIGIDGANIYSGLSATPGTYYDFNCGYFPTTTTCTSRPISAYHFVIPTTVLNASGMYVAPPGNVPRNSLYGPGQVFFDTGIQRDFPIHIGGLENQLLSFRTEFFNAFNHPNLYTPSYTLTDVNYDNTAITINGGRMIKFWLKYTF